MGKSVKINEVQSLKSNFTLILLKSFDLLLQMLLQLNLFHFLFVLERKNMVEFCSTNLIKTLVNFTH